MILQEELKKYLVYDASTGFFSRIQKRKGMPDIAGGVDKSNGFRNIGVNGRQMQAHKLAWIYVYGEPPKKSLRHINGDKDDNRIENLVEIKRGCGLSGQDELKEWLDYNPDTGIFRWKKSKQYTIKVGDIAGTLQESGYLGIGFNGKDYRLHRLAWLYVHGYLPEHIDHIDHNRSNNKISNLRQANNLVNGRNQSMMRNNTSGFNGIYWDKSRDKWAVEIRVNDKKIYLGRFNDKQDAIEARRAANIKYGFHENHGLKSQ